MASCIVESPESIEIKGSRSRISRKIRSDRMDTGPNKRLTRIDANRIREAPATNTGVSSAGASCCCFLLLANCF